MFLKSSYQHNNNWGEVEAIKQKWVLQPAKDWRLFICVLWLLWLFICVLWRLWLFTCLYLRLQLLNHSISYRYDLPQLLQLTRLNRDILHGLSTDWALINTWDGHVKGQSQNRKSNEDQHLNLCFSSDISPSLLCLGFAIFHLGQLFL